ncbi:MAG: depolymerase [Deltaproteobacteria bacterium]
MAGRLRMISAALLITAAVCYSASAAGIEPVRGKLGPYNIEMEKSSVSGLSAGGFFASQFFVAYSGIMSGVGVFAGGPYGCARGDLLKAVNDCMACPCFLTFEVMTQLLNDARTHARNHRVDPLENLKSKKVFLFGGLADKTVQPGVVDRVYDWYLKAGVPRSSIYYKKGLIAGHALPTVSYGNKCDEVDSPPWMSACNYDGAGEVFKHIYGALNPPAPAAALTGKLMEFGQAEFIDPRPANPEELAREAGLNEFGYAYVPRSCQEGQVCRIHVVFHGCRQVYNQDPEGKDLVNGGGVAFGLKMVLHAGYNEWADANRIIVLYPQAQKSNVNPNGCFDWWGYLAGTKDTYPTKDAPQLKAVRAMMKALSGK